MTPIITYFLNAEDNVIRNGYNHELTYFKNLRFENQTVDTFLLEYVYVVCNSGVSAKCAKTICDRVMGAIRSGRPDWAEEIPRVPWKRVAITEAVKHQNLWFQMVRESSDKIETIRSFPSLGGEALGYHLARNLGIDCVKPDRHLKALAKRFGFATPLAMCLEIQKVFPGERLGVIDYILWRYCEMYGSEV